MHCMLGLMVSMYLSVIVLEGRGGCDDYVCGEETQERIH